jgi:hypothetical protein
MRPRKALTEDELLAYLKLTIWDHEQTGVSRDELLEFVEVSGLLTEEEMARALSLLDRAFKDAYASLNADMTERMKTDDELRAYIRTTFSDCHWIEDMAVDLMADDDGLSDADVHRILELLRTATITLRVTFPGSDDD